METLPTKPEVLAVEEAHRAAQARLGIAAAYLALRDWEGVNPVNPAVTSGLWLTRSLRVIRAIRRKSSRLAKAYYQLARAIETGYVLGLPDYTAKPEQVTMGGLRKHYLDLLLDTAQIDTPSVDFAISINDSDERWLVRELQAADISGADSNGKSALLEAVDLSAYIQDWIEVAEYETDDDSIEIDEFEWEDDSLTPEEISELFADELEDAAKAQADKVEAIEKLQEREGIDSERALQDARDAHVASGNIGAGRVDAAGINSGRELIDRTQHRDRRVQMIARGTGPNPCAFCAMLASRGFVYRNDVSAVGAGYGGNDVKKYHPNCHCFPVVRWADIPDPTAPGRSEHYSRLWEQEIKGKFGVTHVNGKAKNNALNAWRRLLWAENRELEREKQRQRRARARGRAAAASLYSA